MEHETLKEWLDREEREKAEKEHETLVLMCNMMWRIDVEGHGVIKWQHSRKQFFVSLERLHKERHNRSLLLRMLRCCVEVMMQLIPTFRGITLDIMRERKWMIPGSVKGRFTQTRMPRTVIRWFLEGLPNKCVVFIQENVRDLGIPTQWPYFPSEIRNMHCFGGDELKVVCYKEDNVL